jgi:signal transduction histidine kinase
MAKKTAPPTNVSKKGTPRGEEEFRALEDQLHAVRAIGEALATSVGLDALFAKTVPNVSKLMRAERSTLFLYDDAAKQIWSKVAEGEGGREIRLKLGQGIAGWVAEHNASVNIADAYADARFNPEIDAQTGYRTRSVAAVPLADKQGKLIGVLQVLNHQGGPFDVTDVGLLETIGVQTVYAIENARLSQELIDQNKELEAARHRAERRRGELDLLYQLEQEVAGAADLDDLLSSVITRACERLRSDAGSVLLLDQDSGRLFFRAATGAHSNELKKVSLPPGEGLVGWAAQKGEAVVVNRPEDDPRHDKKIAQKINYPVQALMAVPLVWDKQIIGAVEVLNPRPRPTGAVGYDDEDLKVLTLIAGQLSRSVALARQRQARIETDRLAFLGRMLAGVAHDLRNPMTVISGYAQIMAMEDDGGERQSRCELVLNQIDEMTAMIGDLLAFARGDSVLKPATVEVAVLADEVKNALSLHCKPRGINLEVQATGRAATVDVGRVRRIIHNLAKNAVDVLSRNGVLEIQISEQSGGLGIIVKDTGPGIPETVRARLFEPFVTSGKPNGTGLGLSIVKRFVDDHAGSIRVESGAGQGTAFFIELPPAQQTARAEAS